MSALPLRLAILTAIAAVPVVLAACAGGTNETASSDESALTGAEERLDALILEAFATSTTTNYTLDQTSDRSCFATSSTTKVLQWNVLGGQWFAPTLRASLAQRGVTEQLTVIETPSATSGLLDIQFVGNPTGPFLVSPPLCGADGGAGSAVVLLTCKDIASTGMMTSITPDQCTHGAPAASSPSL